MLEKLHCQEKIDKEFVFENVGYLIANLYQNAIRREIKGKYETASLLLYRILEAVEQKRLWNYGIDTECANFLKLDSNIDDLQIKVNRLRRKIKGFGEIRNLDQKVSLMAGYILLAAIGDDIIKTKKPGLEHIRLNRLKDKVDSRNKSIFAHGYEFIDKKKYSEFKEVVVEYMDSLCVLEDIDKDKLFSVCEFIRL